MELTLEFVEIPKGLIEVLQNAGLTVEKMMNLLILQKN